MKIAVISRGTPSQDHPLYGIFEFDQAKALVQAGHEVSFVATDFRAASFKRSYGLRQYDKEGVHVFELSLPINVYRRGIPMLRRLLLIPFRAMLKSQGRPDIVHAHFYFMGNIASILKKKYHLPLVLTEHSSKLNKTIDHISALDQKIASHAFGQCDQLITVSDTLRENILQNFRIQSQVVPNMVDDHCFHYGGRPVEQTPFVYVSVGNLLPIKGFDKLIQAYAIVHDDDKLIIIGGGPEKERLQEQVNQLGLSDSVTLTGPLERTKINEIYKNCHAFVLASESETFGVSYIEALYAGLPVVATRCGGPESFVNESNGTLVAVNDVQAIAKGLRRIRENYDSYDSQKISADCIARFSPSSIAKALEKVYQSVMEKASAQ